MPQEILSSLLDDAKHLTLLPTLNVKAKRFQDIGEQNLITRHMGPEYAWREKTLSMGYFLICVHKKLYRIRFQEIKIGSLQGFEKIEFFSLFLMRKRLSSGQKWFLRPYFPLIRGMFVFGSGLRSSSARNENLRPLLKTNIPLIRGKYGLQNHFWPLESRFLMRKGEKDSIFSKSS